MSNTARANTVILLTAVAFVGIWYWVGGIVGFFVAVFAAFFVFFVSGKILVPEDPNKPVFDLMADMNLFADKIIEILNKK